MIRVAIGSQTADSQTADSQTADSQTADSQTADSQTVDCLERSIARSSQPCRRQHTPREMTQRLVFLTSASSLHAQVAHQDHLSLSQKNLQDQLFGATVSTGRCRSHSGLGSGG